MAKAKTTADGLLKAREPQQIFLTDTAAAKEARKQLLSELEHGHPLLQAKTPAAVELLTRLALQRIKSLYEPKHGPSVEAFLVSLTRAVALGLHTHSGKYVHASAKARALTSSPSAQGSLLSAATAYGVKRLTAGFWYGPKFTGPGRVLLYYFETADGPLALIELIAREEAGVAEAFEAEGFAPSVLEQVVATMRSCFAETALAADAIEPCLPQLLWPLDNEDGWVALTPLPAFTVYNSIFAMRRYVASLPSDERVRSASFKVGSGQAQNISASAADLAGNLPLLTCLPPQPRLGSAAVRYLPHSASLISLPSKAEKGRFYVDTREWPNRSKAIFFSKAARRHVLHVLARALELRDLALQFPEATPSRAADGGAVQDLAAGAALCPELARALVPWVLGALTSGEDHRSGTFTPADWERYRGSVLHAIQTLEA